MMISLLNIFKPAIKPSHPPEVEWQAAPDDFFKNLEGIHIWRIKWQDILAQQYISSLSEDEYQKVLKYRSPKDRKKRIISRGILKELSSKYLISPPKNLNYVSNRFGKPFIADHANDLQFNISHSTDYILMAFGFDQSPLGIDIEKNNLLFDYLDIADQYFSDHEKESLDCESPSEQFFKIWTRKEAMMKAIGEGLKDAFFQVDILEDSVELENTPALFLKTFRTTDDYLFSIAQSSGVQELHFFEFQQKQ